MCSCAGPHSWLLCKTAAFWRSVQCDSMLLQLPLRLEGGSSELLLIKGQRRKYSLRIFKMACCCCYTASSNICHQEGPRSCHAVLEEEKEDSVCCSLFFWKVCIPVYNLQKLSPHLPLLRVTARLFTMFIRTCSPKFPVHGQSQLRQVACAAFQP